MLCKQVYTERSLYATIYREIHMCITMVPLWLKTAELVRRWSTSKCIAVFMLYASQKLLYLVEPPGSVVESPQHVVDQSHNLPVQVSRLTETFSFMCIMFSLCISDKLRNFYLALFQH